MLVNGAQVGNYRILQRVGEGGLATVYKVRHASLQTEYALKVLKNDNAGLRMRLLQEGRIQAGLRHPNVVAVNDVVDVDGHVGLIMEFVDGTTLKDVLEGPPLPLADALSLFQQILSGVAAAHRQGVLHRDLKPANVLLAVQGRRVLAKITDFGVAKISGEESIASMTRTGTMLGTPGYMAPEQALDASRADLRADVFSLGVILYEMISGKPPFDGRDMLAILNAVAAGACVPLRDRAPGCPTKIAEAAHRAMQADPNQRFENCDEFARALFGAPAEEAWAGAALLDAARGNTLPPKDRRARPSLDTGGRGDAELIDEDPPTMPDPGLRRPDSPPTIAPAVDALDDSLGHGFRSFESSLGGLADGMPRISLPNATMLPQDLEDAASPGDRRVVPVSRGKARKPARKTIPPKRKLPWKQVKAALATGLDRARRGVVWTTKFVVLPLALIGGVVAFELNVAAAAAEDARQAALEAREVAATRVDAHLALATSLEAAGASVERLAEARQAVAAATDTEARVAAARALFQAMDRELKMLTPPADQAEALQRRAIRRSLEDLGASWQAYEEAITRHERTIRRPDVGIAMELLARR